jgi:hypothetical protein
MVWRLWPRFRELSSKFGLLNERQHIISLLGLQNTTEHFKPSSTVHVHFLVPSDLQEDIRSTKHLSIFPSKFQDVSLCFTVYTRKHTTKPQPTGGIVEKKDSQITSVLCERVLVLSFSRFIGVSTESVWQEN